MALTRKDIQDIIRDLKDQISALIAQGDYKMADKLKKEVQEYEKRLRQTKDSMEILRLSGLTVDAGPVKYKDSKGNIWELVNPQGSFWMMECIRGPRKGDTVTFRKEMVESSMTEDACNKDGGPGSGIKGHTTESSEESFWENKLREVAKQKGIPESDIESLISQVKKGGAKAIMSPKDNKQERGMKDSCGEKIYTRGEKEMLKKKILGKDSNYGFEEGDYVLYNGQKAVVRGFNGQEVIIEQNGRRISTHWSNLEEFNGDGAKAVMSPKDSCGEKVFTKGKETKMAKDDLSPISKHWNKANIEYILKNAHLFKPEIVEEAKRLSKIVKDDDATKSGAIKRYGEKEGSFEDACSTNKDADYTISTEKGKLGLYNWFIHRSDGAIVAGGTSKTEEEAKAKANKILRRDIKGQKDADPRVAEAEAIIKLCGGVM